MASELAANTLHAHDNVEFGRSGNWLLEGAPELWIYLRRWAGRWELVCKVFDSLRGWKDGVVPVPGGAEDDALCGRGLAVVAGLSGGRWGHHLTRSRFGGWKIPGKAVWFAQPVPGASIPAPLRRARMAPGRAARALEAMLIDRGLGASLLRAEERSAGMSVLSVRCGLTVWCRGNVIWWRAHAHCEQRVPTDLVDITEQLVSTCMEMESGIAASPAVLERVR